MPPAERIVRPGFFHQNIFKIVAPSQDRVGEKLAILAPGAIPHLWNSLGYNLEDYRTGTFSQVRDLIDGFENFLGPDFYARLMDIMKYNGVSCSLFFWLRG